MKAQHSNAKRHIGPAQKLAYMLGKSKISEKVGMRIRTVYMTETISEKVRRILAACDTVVCVNAQEPEPKPEPEQEQPEPGEEQEEMGDDWDSFVKDHLIVVHVGN